jgi:cytochrome c oxidase subunit 2
MPIVVKAVSQSEFNQWVKEHQPAAMRAVEQVNMKPMTEDELVTQGKAQYDKSCGMCHQANGAGLPPSFPALKKSRVVTGPLESNIKFVLTGVPGTAMQAFGDQMDNKTLAEIITYTRHAWGNDVVTKKHKYSTVAQPQDVENARHSK